MSRYKKKHKHDKRLTTNSSDILNNVVASLIAGILLKILEWLFD